MNGLEIQKRAVLRAQTERSKDIKGVFLRDERGRSKRTKVDGPRDESIGIKMLILRWFRKWFSRAFPRYVPLKNCQYFAFVRRSFKDFKMYKIE